MHYFDSSKEQQCSFLDFIPNSEEHKGKSGNLPKLAFLYTSPQGRMMQSVALSDSCQQEGEYVIVGVAESDVGSTLGVDVEDDTLSYDYCDDAFSVSSLVKNFMLDSPVLHNLDEGFFAYRQGPPSFSEQILPAQSGDDSSTEPILPGSDLLCDALSSSLLSPSIDTSALSQSSASPSSVTKPCSMNNVFRRSAVDDNGEPALERPSGRDHEERESQESLGNDTLTPVSSGDEHDDWSTTDEEEKNQSRAEAALQTLTAKNSRLSRTKWRRQLKLAAKAAAAAAVATRVGQHVTTMVTTSTRTAKKVHPVSTLVRHGHVNPRDFYKKDFSTVTKTGDASFGLSTPSNKND